jgi:hypothetical protein
MSKEWSAAGRDVLAICDGELSVFNPERNHVDIDIVVMDDAACAKLV